MGFHGISWDVYTFDHGRGTTGTSGRAGAAAAPLRCDGAKDQDETGDDSERILGRFPGENLQGTWVANPIDHRGSHGNRRKIIQNHRKL